MEDEQIFHIQYNQPSIGGEDGECDVRSILGSECIDPDVLK